MEWNWQCFAATPPCLTECSSYRVTHQFGNNKVRLRTRGLSLPNEDGLTSQPMTAQLRYQAEVSPCMLFSFYSWFSIGDRRCGEEEKASAVCRRCCPSVLELFFRFDLLARQTPFATPSGGDASRLSYQDAISVRYSSRVSLIVLTL